MAQFSFPALVISMPVMRVCVAAGCEELAVAGFPHCDEHRVIFAARQKARRDQASGSDHAKAFAELYADVWWRKASKAFLAAHPLCAHHAEVGIIEAAKVVDHKVPHRGDKRLFRDQSNWQGLCLTCHNRKTAREVLVARR